ncbi:hypothetical protein METSCH_E03110 [Metschnikowia aff. pulcherrima]|uniref:NmrA-like domain-containing protein n=1 Tax=Metschnikowia aff. pulcherrima TaxID=2163413 RepID=A0A4P6XR86_9ASCO|nr:hypothetical protein METSCH_E03110 [Metschnikowia aff. pulcherrima]
MSKPTVAVFGLNGALGASTLAAFLSPIFSEKINLPVLAVTRDASKKESSKYVKYIQGDLENGKEELAQKLANVDVVISLVGASPAVFGNLEEILKQVKPKVYIPSQFGIDIPAAGKVFPGLLQIKETHLEKVRALGIKVVDIATSLFAGGPWLRKVIGQVGGNAQEKTVTYLGEPNTKFSYTTIDDIGKVVASVATKAVAGEFPDHINVQSGLITPEEIIKTYESENNTKLEVKEIVPKERALEQAKEVWAQGFDGTKFLYYLSVLISQGPGSGISFIENDDELVNPGESLWKWSKF